MSFSTTPVSTTPLSTNQFPVSAVAVPNEAGGALTALEGGPESTDSNGNRTAPASMYVKDGNDITQGLIADSAVTGDNAGTISAKLRGLLKIITDVWDSVNHRLHVNVDGGTVVAQAVAGTALGADQTNSELRVSLYATNATAGDTAVGVTGGNSLKVNITNAQLPGNITQVGGNTVVTGGASGLLAVAGPVASGGTNADNPVKHGGVFNTTQPTVTNGQIVDAQHTARGAAIVATGVDGFTSVVQAVAGTALAADQTNSELRVSNYVKTTTAGDTALTLGQATMANSLPVAIASNQGAIGSVVAQAVAGTALAADQTNSELRVSNYVKTTTAGDTALTLGQATRANSLPVTLASDQPANAYTQVYSTTQTGVSAWAGSGDITGMHIYSQLAININVSAITGTSIAFNVKRKDSFGIYQTVQTAAAITTAGTQSLDIGQGMALAKSFGDILQITVTLVAITSVSFTVDVEAR